MSTILDINNTLSLREPLKESLILFDRLINKAHIMSDIDKNQKIENIRSICQNYYAELVKSKPTYPAKQLVFTDFERNFASICFSIATGIGKTRLMGAFIAYLVMEKGMRNFFILSPNLTIYNKLRLDFGEPSYEKYVFKAFSDLTNNINIIDGDNYETKGIKQTDNSIQLNIFNIGKINTDIKTTKKDGKELAPKIKRFRETLGDSYYNYLVNLNDLVIIMDEAHRYFGDRGIETLNELNPVLGIELTATPFFSTNKKSEGERIFKFRNVVYEYGLSDAINEENLDFKYIKTPAIATRENTDFTNINKEEIEKMKLNDAIQVHRKTKLAIDNYIAENHAKPVKPIILVTCSDTEHSTKIYNYLTSKDFYNGTFNDKVLQIDSTKSDDEQIAQLLTIENPNNPYVIVLHVDMLKEGWDVANLYTIVPLRASNANILIEQTIGRGLRLPFSAKPTGIELIDRLTILEHERFEEVLNQARDKNYNFGQIKYNENELYSKKEIITTKSKIETEIDEESVEIENLTDEKTKQIYRRKNIAKKILTSVLKKGIADKKYSTTNEIKSSKAEEEIIEYSKKVLNENDEFKTMSVKEKKEVEKLIAKECNNIVNTVLKENIYIPNIIVSLTQNQLELEDFDLDVSNFTEKIEEQDIKLIIRNLKDSKKVDEIIIKAQKILFPEQLILSVLQKKSKNVYALYSEIYVKLCLQAITEINKILTDKNNLNTTLLLYKDIIADRIYNQIEKHLKLTTISNAEPQAQPFSEILQWNFTKSKDDDIIDYRETVNAKLLPSKIFSGFSKSCHDKYKFDSVPEKQFAEILEETKEVLKWMRPSQNQFNIWYNNKSNRYIPDFVAETEKNIYMIEIKAENEINTELVKEKSKSAIDYCKSASEINKKNGEKEWKYILIPHDKISRTITFNWLINQFEKK